MLVFPHLNRENKLLHSVSNSWGYIDRATKCYWDW